MLNRDVLSQDLTPFFLFLFHPTFRLTVLDKSGVRVIILGMKNLVLVLITVIALASLSKTQYPPSLFILLFIIHAGSIYFWWTMIVERKEKPGHDSFGKKLDPTEPYGKWCLDEQAYSQNGFWYCLCDVNGFGGFVLYLTIAECGVIWIYNFLS